MIILMLVVWTIVGTAIMYGLWKSTDFESYSLPAKIFAAFIGGPIFWAAFIFGVVLGIALVIIHILNGGEK